MSVLNYRRGLLRLWLVFTIPWVSYFAWSGITAYGYAESYGDVARSYANMVVQMNASERSAPEYSSEYLTKANYREKAAQYRKDRDEALETAWAFREEVEQAYTFGPTVPLVLLVSYFIGTFVIRGFTQGRDGKKPDNPTISLTTSDVNIEIPLRTETHEQLHEPVAAKDARPGPWTDSEKLKVFLAICGMAFLLGQSAINRPCSMLSGEYWLFYILTTAMLLWRLNAWRKDRALRRAERVIFYCAIVFCFAWFGNLALQKHKCGDAGDDASILSPPTRTARTAQEFPTEDAHNRSDR
jgi:hypothetical protein